MKYLKLSQGKVAKVCKCHYDLVAGYKWCFTDGYARRTQRISGGWRKGNLKNKSMTMHRVIANPGPKQQVDHINRDKLDNRCTNLRCVSQRQNIINRTKQSNNTSGYKGVQYRRDRGTWRAVIRVNRRMITLGTFKRKEDAAIKYNQAARQYFGEFAVLNEVAV